MKIKTPLILLAILFLQINATCQFTNLFKKPSIADEYARNSISFILLDFEDEKHFKDLKEGVCNGIVPAKFDHNDLKKVTLKAPFDHSYLKDLSLRQKLKLSSSSCIGSVLFLMVPLGTELIERKRPLKQILTQNAQFLKKSITDTRYANEVIKYWWGINEGSYSTALIQKRGFYNATDMDVNIADAEKIGRAMLADEGEKLIKNSYIMVLDFYNVKSKTEIYDLREKKKGKKVNRKRKGFKGNLNAYLFKLNYNDTVQGYFNECFSENNKINETKLETIFDNVHSPIEYVISESVRVNATTSKAREIKKNLKKKNKQELAADFVNKGVFEILDNVEKKIEDFRVKTPVTQTRPIGAKIGKKEGVILHRF